MIIIALPIIFSALLSGYVWKNSSQKNAYSIILLIIALIAPVLPSFDNEEPQLVLSAGLFVGWIISLINEPSIKTNKIAQFIKGFVSLSFLLGFIVNFLAFIVDFVIWQDYYNEIIIEVGQGLTIAIFIIVGIKRVRKNKELVGKLIS